MKDRKEERELLERKILACLIMDYDWLIDLLDIPSEYFTGDNKELITIMRKAWTSDPVILASKSMNLSKEEIRDIASETLWVSEFENYIRQLKDLISRDKHAYRCVIAKGILDHLFEIIKRNDSEEMAILQQWANDRA